MVYFPKYDMYAHLEGSWGVDSRLSEATFVYHVLSSSRRNVSALLKMFYKITSTSSSIRKRKSLRLCEPCTCRCDVMASYYK